MLFWRARRADPTPEPDNPVSTIDVVESVDAPTAVDATENAASNVVALQPARLSERLADMPRGDAVAASSTEIAVVPVTALVSADLFEQPIYRPTVVALRRALQRRTPSNHVVILGEPGIGRRSLAETLANEAAVSRAAPAEWIYICGLGTGSTAHVLPVPAGDGPRVAAAINVAIDRSFAAGERLVASDDARMSLTLLDEDYNHAIEQPVVDLRNRAEAQNIALVKTADGYVLAPMFDGRVVRADVFRSLPDTLRREVEGKITSLEAELKSLLVAALDLGSEFDTKRAALFEDVAVRAVQPQTSVAKTFVPATPQTTIAFDALEHRLVAQTAAHAKAASLGRQLPSSGIRAHAISNSQRLTCAPVRIAREMSASALRGAIGRDGDGKISIVPGELMLANGGYLVVEAWRIASQPAGWAALVTALTTKTVVPVCGPGIAVAAEPIDLDVTLIVVADDKSWRAISDIEPGAANHFTHVRMPASVPVAEANEKSVSEIAEAIAARRGLKPLDRKTSNAIFKDARSRSDAGRASLNLVALDALLREADLIAGENGRVVIAQSDVEAASRALKQGANG